MNIDFIREYCMSFPGATEELQWESSLLFKVGGKIFVITGSDNVSENLLSLKADPEKFEELMEQRGVMPAPYLARNKWIAIQRSAGVKTSELKELIRTSYELVFGKLPKKIQSSITAGI
ncbi:MAG: MmcQ/YjbR family DNA-binding protein [Ignavibacteria bacterium]